MTDGGSDASDDGLPLKAGHIVENEHDDDSDNGNDAERGLTSSRSGGGVFGKCCDSRNKKKRWCIWIIIPLLMTTALLLFMSFKKVSSTQYGVKYTRYSKQLDEAVRTGGLHIGPPGYSFIKFPSTFITVDLPDGTCVSSDGLRVQFSVTFQYQMPEEWLVDAILRYRKFEGWARVVEAAGTSAVQHSCAEFNIANFQNKRGVIQSTMEDNLRLKLEGTQADGADGVFARAISLQLRNVGLPFLYNDAVAAKQRAAEDITLAKNERTQATTKARTKLLTANEEARKILDTARNDAEVTLTQARLKANETLFAFNTEAEVIDRVKNALNLTTDGVLTYIANDFVASASKLSVTASEPAKFSRRDEL